MTEMIVLLALAVLVALVAATARTVHDDGFGRRLPPPSHWPDPFDPGSRLRSS